MLQEIRAGVQSWLNRETDKSIILAQWNNVIIVRFGFVSALALFAGLVSFITVFRAIGVSREAMRDLLILSPLSLILFSFAQGMILSRGSAAERLRSVSFGFFGGLSGVLATFAAASIYYRIDFVRMLDVSVLLAAFIHSYARTACINYGCCHGKERTGADRLCVIYKHPAAKAVRVSSLANRPLYPVQLYESAGCFAIGAILLLMALAGARSGLMLGTYLLAYGSLRFSCEFYRGEAERRIGHFTVYQWICAGFVLAGACVILFALLRSAPAAIALNVDNLLEPLHFLPFLIGMPLVIFFFYGFHYGTVGRWR